MKRFLAGSTAIAALALAVPFAALADLNQTTTLASNTSLNLETGTLTGAVDLLWNGTTLTPQGNATAIVIGDIPFTLVSVAIMQNLSPYTKAAISGSDVKANNVIAVKTNANRYAKVLIQSNSAGSIRLQFLTYGAPAATGGAPTITGILNNSSRIPIGLPNYGIAPSSLFVITGSGLADAGDPVLQSSASPGIPLTLNGASISVTVNGVTTRPGLWYTSPTQLAAVLPAATPVGNGTITVTYKGVTSAPAAIKVVANAVGINSYNGNLGVATDAATGALLTFSKSAAPGQAIVLWTTGLGADPADSDTVFANPPHAVEAPLKIYIGGVLATILYQGSSGYPGVNQINVLVPDTVSVGCNVSVAAVTGSVLSNVVTIPVNRSGGTCVDSVTGLNGQQVATANVRTGLVSLVQTNEPNNAGNIVVTNSANAAFGKYGGLADAATGAVATPGSCVAFPVVVGGLVTFTGLDAGLITLSGPPYLEVSLAGQAGLKGTSHALLPDGSIPKTGGTFTFKGFGGTDVGTFTTTIDLTNPLLTWTDPSAAANINKAQDLTITWTGGNPGTYVSISGSSVTANSGGAGPSAGYTCLAKAEDGRFTVPSYILQSLPTGAGGVVVQNLLYAPLTATGLDIGLLAGTISYSAKSNYQ